MQIHEIQRTTKNKSKKIVGRGGKRGKTSGRGHKGQKQHGGTPRPEIRDMIKKIPKLRGYNFASIKDKPLVVNLSVIEDAYGDGDTVNPETLFAQKIIKGSKARVADIKILAHGTLTKKIIVEQCAVSEAAAQKITAAGGTVRA
ncbi:MAG: uL15 family ribosomal protein [Candidatus Pacebacteria bacterium]|nr:uL15 family ribosomal protein [Candidatus Paceibacterota bacterium]MCD8528339.1 uL15 family ribosomal protein [Candidatus Paceibacterota bacterium]MCD8563803.1 uL15 family ribosomal protein [Candidatus Paceibacterota bacterium]